MPNQSHDSNVQNSLMEEYLNDQSLMEELLNNPSSCSSETNTEISIPSPSSNSFQSSSLPSDSSSSLFQSLASDSEQRCNIYFEKFSNRLNALLGLFTQFPKGYTLGVMITKAFGTLSYNTVKLGDTIDETSLIPILMEDAEIYEKLDFNSSSLSIDDDQTCIRCRIQFSIKNNGITPCLYHDGRIQLTAKLSLACSSCNAPTLYDGCAVRQYHIFDHIPLGFSGLYLDFSLTRPAESMGVSNCPQIIAINCKIIYTSCGFEVARVSVVNFDLHVILDAYIKPSGKIFDLNTEITGIQMNHFTSALPLNIIRGWFLKNLSSEAFLIGHDLDEGLIGLKLVHTNLIDTSYLACTEENQNYAFYKPSLREVARKYLAIEDQFLSSNEHENRECALIVCKLGQYFLRRLQNFN